MRRFDQEDGEGRRASIPDGVAPDELTHERVSELLEQAAKAEQPLGRDPVTDQPIFLKVGRFGPYIMRGMPEDEDKKNASLLKGMKPEDVDLATALKLLVLPREVGKHPESGNPIMAYNGRFGPYIKCGDDTRSLPADLSPIEVSLEQALALLAQPKAQRRGFGAPREPLKVVGESPVTKQPINLFDGRYGYYVTDGETNASLPKGASHETLTLEEALRLLAERAALGPPAKKRRGAKKGAAPKKKKAAAAVDGDAGDGEAPAKKKKAKKSAPTAPVAAKKTPKKKAAKKGKKKVAK
jgi:DNA topoisomerase-1